MARSKATDKGFSKATMTYDHKLLHNWTELIKTFKTSPNNNIFEQL